MKRTFVKFIIMVLATSLGMSHPLSGAEIEGVQFDNAYEAEGIRLKIHGTGLFRYLGVVKAYVGALYLPEGTFALDVLSDIPKRLEVEYFHALKGEDFGVTTNKIIAKNTDSQTLKSIREKIDFHNSSEVEQYFSGEEYNKIWLHFLNPFQREDLGNQWFHEVGFSLHDVPGESTAENRVERELLSTRIKIYRSSRLTLRV